MTRENYSEDDTRAKRITPALIHAGWDEAMIRRAVPVGKGAVEMGPNNIPQRGRGGVADYLLSVIVREKAEPVPVAVVEAKKDSKSPNLGMPQALQYARALNVPFAFSTNGHMFTEADITVQMSLPPRKMSEFPGPDKLLAQYEKARRFSLAETPAAPLLTPRSGKSGEPRYYQDAAIRAAMEKLAQCEIEDKPRRILLPLATGAGKTFIAVNLLRRIAQTKQLRRALFLCDRKELREQARAAFVKEFGGNALVVSNKNGRNTAQNAKIHIATYQTLGMGRDGDSDDQNAPTDGAIFHQFYPEPDYFSHIVIDECHRSAWGEWSPPLTRNPNAVHIGLTATPRTLKIPPHINATDEGREDDKISRDNLKHFGDPVYEYSIVRGMDDGYLAFLLLDKARSNLDMAGGIPGKKLAEHSPRNAVTGEPVPADELAKHYLPSSFEKNLLLPDRVRAMCADLFHKLREDGGPDQKTIVFCETIEHAADVVREMGNLRAKLAQDNGELPPDEYAFQCTSGTDSPALIEKFRDLQNSQFIAATVDLLSTGVDIPCVRNIAFFRHIKSPILFHQMLGRGTRIDEETGKLAFTVYDYTNAAILMGEELASRAKKKRDDAPQTGDDDDEAVPRRKIRADGLEVWINDLGKFAMADGQFISRKEYENRIAKRLREQVRDLSDFNARWIDRSRREKMMRFLAANGLSPSASLLVGGRDSEDLYDYLANVVWDANPKTRMQRADNFAANSAEWLDSMDPAAADVVRAIIAVFADGGTDELESDGIYSAPRVAKAGGFKSLQTAGNPGKTITEIKRRLFEV